MFKKNLMLILIVLFLFTACTSNNTIEETDAQKVPEEVTVPVVNNVLEFSELSPSEQSIYKEYLNTLSKEELSEFLEKSIATADFTKEEVSEIIGDINIDNLSLSEGENLKPYANIDFKVDIVMADNEEVFKKDLADEYIQRFQEHLRENIVYSLKSKVVTIRVVDENGNVMQEMIAEPLHSESDNKYILQESLETQAQTVAFDYGELNDYQFTLEKFGVKIGTNELFVEYFVDNSHFETDDASQELADFNATVKSYLLDNENVKDYILSENIDTITISSYSRPTRDYENIITSFKIE